MSKTIDLRLVADSIKTEMKSYNQMETEINGVDSEELLNYFDVKDFIEHFESQDIIGEMDFYEVLKNISVDDAVKYYSVDEILDEIGEEACKRYFNIKINE